MNAPCDKSVLCPAITSPGSAYEFPIANFSSERPDELIFVGVEFGEPGGPPMGTTWSTPGCVSWCQSTISQEDADECAARQQFLCQRELPPDVPPGTDGQSKPDIPSPPVVPPPGTPPPPPRQGVYYNTDQTCGFTCPDGSSQQGFIAAGTVAAASVAEANAIAHSLACKQVQSKAICVPKLDLFACSDPLFEKTPYSFQVDVKTASPIQSLTASGLPPELTMDGNGLITGTPTTPGDYAFTVTCTTADGTKSVTSDFHVLGIEGSRFLPDAKVDNNYNYQFTSGGVGIEYFVTDGALPNGLTMDSGGAISGSADTVGIYHFTVTVRDAFFNECSRDFSLDVTGPKFNNGDPPPGQECVSYGPFSFSAAGIGTVTYSGTLPPSLSLDPNTGAVTGVPTEKGTQQFVITATDSDSPPNSNTRTWNVVIAPSTDINFGVPVPKSVDDITHWEDLGTAGTAFGSMAGTVGHFHWKGVITNPSVYYVRTNLDHCSGAPPFSVRIDVTWTINNHSTHSAVGFDIWYRGNNVPPFGNYFASGSGTGTFPVVLVFDAAGDIQVRIDVANPDHDPDDEMTIVVTLSQV